MKSFLASLFLVLQFQPALGAVACLERSLQPANQECAMPEHATPLQHGVSESTSGMTPDCPLATICAPASVAVPGISGRMETAFLLETASVITDDSRPLDVFSSPPFHPPRV